LFILTGAGFSGFWYHLGLLQGSPNLHQQDFYCYSSGCLSLVLAFLNSTVDNTYDTSYSIQQAWLQGNITRYDMVDWFLQDVVFPVYEMNFLPRIHVLVTTASQGVHIETASSLEELKDLLIKTTWIPYVTGEGVMSGEEDYYLDGGFSRVLHPTCETNLRVPVTWKTTIHTLDPGFDRETALDFWRMGRLQSVQNPVFSTV
jgi:hypothetical protein